MTSASAALASSRKKQTKQRKNKPQRNQETTASKHPRSACSGLSRTLLVHAISPPNDHRSTPRVMTGRAKPVCRAVRPPCRRFLTSSAPAASRRKHADPRIRGSAEKRILDDYAHLRDNYGTVISLVSLPFFVCLALLTTHNLGIMQLRQSTRSSWPTASSASQNFESTHDSQRYNTGTG